MEFVACKVCNIVAPRPQQGHSQLVVHTLCTDDDIVATEEVATVVTGAVDTGSPTIAGIDEVENIAISPLPIN